MAQVLSRAAFMEHVAHLLQLLPSQVAELWFGDAGLDSIAVYEIVMFTEELGVTLTEADLTRADNVEDLYRAYALARVLPDDASS